MHLVLCLMEGTNSTEGTAAVGVKLLGSISEFVQLGICYREPQYCSVGGKVSLLNSAL